MSHDQDIEKLGLKDVTSRSDELRAASQVKANSIETQYLSQSASYQTPLEMGGSPIPGSALFEGDTQAKKRPNLSAAAAWAECARLLREEDDDLIEGWSAELR